MIECADYFNCLSQNGIRFFSGVPDSLLKDICAYIADHTTAQNHVIAANEGAAVSLAAGYYLATENPGLVYMQNSGIGNAVNPLMSLTDPDVYSIPVLLMIGWRGEPGYKDEPQHVKQGKITLSLLEALGIRYQVHPDNMDAAARCVQEACSYVGQMQAPYALVIRKNTFAPYKLKNKTPDLHEMNREAAIMQVLSHLGKSAIVVSTTGMASREVFDFRTRMKQGHQQDFLTVGSMGHACQIALGIAVQTPERVVYCLDGDGAFIMHMGSTAVVGAQRPKNLRHVVINNGAHDSVGGQPTAGFLIDVPQVARGCGYTWTRSVARSSELAAALRELDAVDGLALLEIKVNKGHRPELGRPTQTPCENKKDFMALLAQLETVHISSSRYGK